MLADDGEEGQQVGDPEKLSDPRTDVDEFHIAPRRSGRYIKPDQSTETHAVQVGQFGQIQNNPLCVRNQRADFNVKHIGGTSQQLLGVDAVREFNVLRDSYGAEYGKRPGGQVSIVTQSGTNQLHGSIYDFLRNNALDAPNYFDQGSAPPFQRNQFGGAIGGPIQKDKTFFFANYEGFIQNLHQTSAAFVPDLASRAKAVPSVQPLLNLWITPPANAPDFNGIAQVFSSPLQTIRENFGNARVDHIFSSKDTFSAAYTIDDGHDFTPTTANPYSTDILTLREHVRLERNLSQNIISDC